MKGGGSDGGLKGGLLLEWVCFGVLVGMVEVVFLLFLFGCGYFVNDCIDLIFGFKSIFLLDNLVCVYIWIDFFFFLVQYSFMIFLCLIYGFVLLCVLDGFV